MKTYGVVVVGCGHIGEEHSKDIYYRDNIRMVGFVDTDPARASAFARKFSGESYGTDYREYLDNPRADIFIVATNTESHYEITRECARHSKHVLCEKPMGIDFESTRLFRDMAVKAGTKIKVGHILRHNRTYLRAYEMIAGGMLGFPLVFRLSHNHHTTDWNRHRGLLEETSPIVDCGVHYYDVMQWFTGSRIRSVMGVRQRLNFDIPPDQYNYGMSCCTLEDGSVGYYEVGWSPSMSSDNIKEIVGPKGRLKIIYQDKRFSHQEEGDLIEYYDAVSGVYHEVNVQAPYKPMYDQLMGLIEMIEKDLPNAKGIDEAFSAARVSFCADHAIRNGGIVDVEVFDMNNRLYSAGRNVKKQNSDFFQKTIDKSQHIM